MNFRLKSPQKSVPCPPRLATKPDNMTRCSYLEAKYGFNLGHTIGLVVCDGELESSVDYDYYDFDDYPSESSLGVETLNF